jgi:hypothetical protein
VGKEKTRILTGNKSMEKGRFVNVNAAFRAHFREIAGIN